MTDNASPFYEGARVAIVNRHWGFSVRWATVSKVYKTGRFILNGDKSRQSRPGHDGMVAWQTGFSGYGLEHVEPVTPELLAEIKKAKEIAGFKDAVRDPKAGKARIPRVQLPPRQMFVHTSEGR